MKPLRKDCQHCSSSWQMSVVYHKWITPLNYALYFVKAVCLGYEIACTHKTLPYFGLEAPCSKSGRYKLIAGHLYNENCLLRDWVGCRSCVFARMCTAELCLLIFVRVCIAVRWYLLGCSRIRQIPQGVTLVSHIWRAHLPIIWSAKTILESGGVKSVQQQQSQSCTQNDSGFMIVMLFILLLIVIVPQ